MRAGRKRKLGHRTPNGELKDSLMGERRDGQSAIYVIEIRDGVVKIGRSVAPKERMKVLQAGHSHPIKLFRSFWVPAELVVKLESLTHKNLRKHGRRARGEVYYIYAEEAAEFVRDALRQFGIILPEEPIEVPISYGHLWGHKRLARVMEGDA